MVKILIYGLNFIENNINIKLNILDAFMKI